MVSALALLAGLALPARDTTRAPARRDDEVTVTMTVDSGRHEVRIKAGPFFLPNMGKMDHHAQMDMGSSPTSSARSTYFLRRRLRWLEAFCRTPSAA